MEELQALWRNASVSEERPVSPQELDAMVNHRSSDELQKFRQVIMLEYAFTWVIIPLLIVGAIWRPQYLVAAIPLVALMGYLLYFYRRTLKQFDQIHVADDLQTYLQRALTFLKAYVRHYKIVCWASGAVGFVTGYLMGLEEEDEGGMLIESSPIWDLALVAGSIMLVLLFCHFYIKHLYQARINNLEKLLGEFSEA